MDDARRNHARLRPRPASVDVAARGGFAVAFVGAGLASPLRLTPWPEAVADLLIAFALIAGVILFVRSFFGVAGRLRAARRRTPERLALDPQRRPAQTDAWLHVVSGADPNRVAEAAVAVASELMGGGGRVLLLDAGRRLDLHEVFGREPRWGVGECLAGTLPLLGLVQDTGCPGLYLLAQGTAVRAEDWSRLGAVLDEAAPHFGHAVLAVDAAAPRAAGEAVAGRRLEAWWAGARLTTPALALSERLGVALGTFPIEGDLEAALQPMRERPRPLRAATEPSAPPLVPLVPLATPALAAVAGVPAAPAVPAILDWDPRVRDRLRFLVWMRRLESEGAPVRAS